MDLAEWEGLEKTWICLPEFRHPFHVDVDQAMAPNGSKWLNGLVKSQ